MQSINSDPKLSSSPNTMTYQYRRLITYTVRLKKKKKKKQTHNTLVFFFFFQSHIIFQAAFVATFWVFAFRGRYDETAHQFTLDRTLVTRDVAKIVEKRSSVLHQRNLKISGLKMGSALRFRTLRCRARIHRKMHIFVMSYQSIRVWFIPLKGELNK